MQSLVLLTLDINFGQNPPQLGRSKGNRIKHYDDGCKLMMRDTKQRKR
jgi:hypothetical protein